MRKKLFVQNKFGEKLMILMEWRRNSSDRFTKRPAVVLVHGFGVNKNESKGQFTELSKKLVSNDFLVFRFDFSGCGESEGEFIETSLTKQIEDLRSIMGFVENQQMVNKQKISIVAMSFGVAVSVGLSWPVRTMIFLSGTSHPLVSLRKLFGENYNPNGVSTYYGKTRTRSVGPQFWKDLKKYNLPKLIRKIKSSILIVHGEKDKKVSISEAKEYFKNIRSKKKMVIIKNADHGFDKKSQLDKVVFFVLKWLKTNLALTN